MPAVAVLALLLLTAVIPPSTAVHQGEPIVLELAGGSGDAWAVAVRSHDEPTSVEGNEVIPVMQLRGPFKHSVASAGIIELIMNEEGRFQRTWGGIAFVFRGDDEVHVEALGDTEGVPDISSPAELGPQEDGAPIIEAAERRSMDPGEWRYFVAWGAGSASSTFQLRGEGFTVEEIVEGNGYALGNDELVSGGGVHAQQSLGFPPGTSSGDRGHAGAGATAVFDTGITLDTTAPLTGMFMGWHMWDACTRSNSCVSAGPTMDGAAGQVMDSGFSNISIETPATGEAWNKWGVYWFAPINEPYELYYPGRATGPYRFHVDHLVDVSGPWYREPAMGQGARLDGEQLVVSLAEVDYERLEAPAGT